MPESAFDDIKDYSRSLLATHAAKAQEVHYKKLVSIQKLFEEDRKALLPFPQSSFDAVLMNNPGVWKNSGIRELVPYLLKALMDRQERAALKAGRMYVGFEKNEKYSALQTIVWERAEDPGRLSETGWRF